jgi:hypothetical protein
MFSSRPTREPTVSDPFVREFTLAGPNGDGRHAYVSKEGAFLGRGVPLLERDALGQWKPRDSAILERLFAKGYGSPVELGRRAMQLRYVAQALNKGDLARANISLVRAELPPLPSADLARAMARADGLLVKYNPDWDDEPRLPEGVPGGGEWTSEEGDATGAMVQKPSQFPIAWMPRKPKRSGSSTLIWRMRRKSPTSSVFPSRMFWVFPP